jgi:hypothetical protein
LKNINVAPNKLGTVQVILDGQQRLTTLFLLMRGSVPPYYQEADITHDPRDLYYNLETGDFQYYQRTRMQDNPLWIRVVKCFNDQSINVFEIAKQMAQEGDDPFALAQRYNNHLTRLRNSDKDDLPVQTVPAHASMEDAIDIFDRVNSQGTKLTDADLALTHMTGKWAQARRVLKAKIGQLDKAHFYFDLTFMTRAMTGVVCQRALFETIHTRPKDELQEGWEKLEGILDYLIAVLPQRAFIHSTWDLNTTNVLIPLIVYLSIHEGKFPNETALKHAIHWLYAAQTWSRYTSQTDQRLEADISLNVRENSPWQSLRNQIIDQRGRIDVKADDMDGRGIQHPIYRMAFILAKAQGAVDWFDGAPLGVVPGKSYNLQNAYIFPSRLLYKNGYESDNHMHRKIVNEIANRVVLNTSHPYADRSPEEYFPIIEEHYPGALTKQFIPMDPLLWKLENFPDFLAARRALIARKINEFMHALIEEPEPVHTMPITELIQLGESTTVEFKSTLQWDVVQKKQATYLRHSVMKTIGAFLNSSGGTLVIGVEDDGNVYGLERDLKLTKNSLDDFQQLLASLLKTQIGPQYVPYVQLRFESIDGKQVCVVEVDKAPEPAFLKTSKGIEFYVRIASTSHALDPEETVKYISMNWD